VPLEALVAPAEREQAPAANTVPSDA